MMVSRRWRIVSVLTLLVVLAVGAIAVFRPSQSGRFIVAHFTSVVGIHPGSDVRVLGVKIGEVVLVRPEGRTVRVELRYDSGTPVPGDARAVIIPPSVVSDRYVQLTPAYTGGAELPDGADLSTTARRYRSNSTTSTGRWTSSTPPHPTGPTKPAR